MSRRWFELLANLTYLRFNYRHFRVGSLPAWVEGDILPADRIESMTMLARAMQDSDGDKAIHLQTIFDTFL